MRKTRPEAEKCCDGAPKGEGARKRMFAVTRNIRGARRTGRGLGCAHPKCRCGFYRLRRSALRLPLFFLEANAFVQWLAKTRAQKARREKGIARAFASFPAIAGKGDRAKRGGKGVGLNASLSLKEFRRGPHPRHHPALALLAPDGPPPPLRFATRGRMKNAPRE